MTRHLLLVDPDPARAVAALAAFSGHDVTAVASAVAARAYLAGSAFDAVAVRAELDPDQSLRTLADGLGVAHVVRYDDPDALAADVTARLGLVRTAASPSADGPSVSIPSAAALPAGEAGETDRAAALADLRDEIGRVAHDLANPLAVIMGNAQLGSEIARAEGADSALLQAFADIETAAGELDRRIARLAALRARIDGLTRSGA